MISLALGLSVVSCSEKEKPVEPQDPKPEKTNPVTVADVLKADPGTTFTDVECLNVVAVNEQGIILQEDGTDDPAGNSVYAYIGQAHEFVVGDMVTISGNTMKRNGLIQFAQGCTITKTWHGDFTQPQPVEFSAADIDAYMKSPSIKYVTYTGTVIVAGNYVNVEVDGTGNIGSLDYMTAEFKEKYNKHSLTITGWLFGSYKTFMYTVPVLVVDNGIPEDNIPEGAIYYNDFDYEVAVQDSEKYGTTKGWPWLDQFDGWKNQKGSGVSAVSYSFKEMSVRTNEASKGSLSLYNGSGNNNIFFGGSETSPNYFVIGNISVPSQNLKLSFGAQRYAQGGANAFLKSNFEVRLSADGQTWSPAIEYDFGGVEDTKDGKWRLATADFTLPAGTNTLYIKFTAKAFSVNRLDDVLLVPGQGGQQVEFTGDVETPLSTVAEVLAGPVDKVYKAEGLAIATHSNGILLQDNTGTILVYKKKHGINAGSKVVVEGNTTEYGGFKQFDATSTVTVTGNGTVTHPAAEEFNASKFESYVNNPSIKYITYKGTLKIERDANYQYHYNVVIDGTSSVEGSVSYPDASLGLQAYEGSKIIVKGYAIGVTGSGDVKYVGTMATSVEPEEKDTVPEEKDALTVEELNKKLDSFGGSTLAEFVAVKGYVAANNENGNLSKAISLVDNTGAAHSGIVIDDGTDYNETTLPVGTKVIVSLQRAKLTTTGTFRKITLAKVYPISEKVEIKVPEIADDQLDNYMGQYVKVKDLTAPADATTWYDSAKKGNTDFAGAKGTTVTAYVTAKANFGAEKIAHRTADLKGVVEQYKDKKEVVPTSLADIAGFKE